MNDTPDKNEHFMRLALADAERGLGRTSPNPAVGAVIVRSGEIIGRGHHERAGGPHAEVNAIADARARGHDPGGATLYVTLEPCNHRGRTPPCTEAVLGAGIAEVVIGTNDPNPQVAGGGAAYLAERGLRVVSGVLRDDCRRLILPFARHSRTGLPWVVMKAGMSLDGKISRQKGQGGAITGPEAQHFVHTLRNRLDAIPIGIGTALIDDPALTCRLPPDADPGGRDPLRVVLDSRLRLPPDCRMLTQKSAAATWIFCAEDADAEREKALVEAGAKVVRTAGTPPGTDAPPPPRKGAFGGLDLPQVLRHLGEAGICSVLVEGGAHVHAAFLAQGLADEAALLFAPCFIGEAGTPLLPGAIGEAALGRVRTERLGRDILVHGFFTDPNSLFPPF